MQTQKQDKQIEKVVIYYKNGDLYLDVKDIDYLKHIHVNEIVLDEMINDLIIYQSSMRKFQNIINNTNYKIFRNIGGK